MADLERPRRTNGLSPPYTPAQVSTWVFMPTLVLEFLLVVSPILPRAASIPCTILFCACATASIYFGYTAMKTDPSDPRLLNANGRENNNSNGSNSNGNSNSQCRVIDPQEPTKQCWICDIQVGEKSMHCKFCNKCVDHFDHHCMWLNTCVGRANYNYFFRTMVCIKAMLFVQAAIQVALIVDIYMGSGATKERAEDWFSVGTVTPAVAIMGVCLVFNFVSMSLIGQLLLFHLKLQKDGITTYQFIVQQNQVRRERAKKENELNTRRQAAIERAKREGKGFLVFRLQHGGSLRTKCGWTIFDPLDEDDEKNETNGDSNGNGENGNDRANTTASNGEP